MLGPLVLQLPILSFLHATQTWSSALACALRAWLSGEGCPRAARYPDAGGAVEWFDCLRDCEGLMSISLWLEMEL